MSAATAPPSPKVSVVSITYNHEAYIREALDGFVAQHVDFPVEVIVADDASTDRTPAIIREYAERYPNLIRPILRAQNVGIQANLTDALSAARGEFLALCEGDDYWTHPDKLSKQVTFLDQHPEVAVCFHPVRLIWTDAGERKGLGEAAIRRVEQIVLRELPRSSWIGDLSLDALVSRNFIQTNSVMYRRLPRYDDIPANIMPLDWYLHVRHAVHGDIAMLPEAMSVYRRHPQGIWYGSSAAPAKFWLTHGPGHVALLEAFLDVVPCNRAREKIFARNGDWVLSTIAKKVPPNEVRKLLEAAVVHHPRIAKLALQHRRAPGRATPFKTVLSKMVASKPSWETIAASALPDPNV